MCLGIDVPIYFTDNNQSFLFSLFLDIYCPLLQATKHNYKSIESIQLIILYCFEFADFLKKKNTQFDSLYRLFAVHSM